MAKYPITYVNGSGKELEEVDADHQVDIGEWIHFKVSNAVGGADTKLRVRAKDVERVEQV